MPRPASLRVVGTLLPLLIALVTAVLVLAIHVPAPALALAVDRDGRGTIVATGYTGGATVVLSRLPASERAIRSVIFYHDEQYALGRGVGTRFLHGFSNHLRTALAQRDYPASTLEAGAAALHDVLAEDPRGRCLLVFGGVLPSNVRNERVDLLKPWIERGGLVVWAGAPFDALYSAPRSGLSPAKLSAPDYHFWPDLYADGGPMQRADDVATPELQFGTFTGNFWNLARLPYERTTFGVTPARFDGPAPAELGFVDGIGDSSVTELQLGKGHLIFFADGIDDEAEAADYVAQLLYTAAWEPNQSTVLELHVGNGGTAFAVPKGTRSIVAYAWTAREAPFAHLDLDGLRR